MYICDLYYFLIQFPVYVAESLNNANHYCADLTFSAINFRYNFENNRKFSYTFRHLKFRPCICGHTAPPFSDDTCCYTIPIQIKFAELHSVSNFADSPTVCAYVNCLYSSVFLTKLLPLKLRRQVFPASYFSFLDIKSHQNFIFRATRMCTIPIIIQFLVRNQFIKLF